MSAKLRGNPPNREQLAALLQDRLVWWNALRETVVDMGAAWRWAHSEAASQWNYRAYLEGERFLAALTPGPEGFELSLNLKTAEWEAVAPADDAERALLASLRATVPAEGTEPAWIHVAIANEATLQLAVKLLLARAGRVQAPRKTGKKRLARPQ